MKNKLFLLLFLIFSFSAFAVKVNISASLESARYGVTNNTLDLVGGSSGTYSYVKPIYTINCEVVQDFDYGEIGLGASYEQGYERQDGETFNAIPIYGIAKFKLNPLYFNAKYGTTMYVDVNTDSSYTNAQYRSMGLWIDLGSGMSIEGSVKSNTVDRNGEQIGTVSYGIAVGINTY